MNYEQMRDALNSAQETFNAADLNATVIARLLAGRLGQVSSNYVLKQLKDELRRYNAHTGRWRA